MGRRWPQYNPRGLCMRLTDVVMASCGMCSSYLHASGFSNEDYLLAYKYRQTVWSSMQDTQCIVSACVWWAAT